MLEIVFEVVEENRLATRGFKFDTPNNAPVTRKESNKGFGTSDINC